MLITPPETFDLAITTLALAAAHYPALHLVEVHMGTLNSNCMPRVKLMGMALSNSEIGLRPEYGYAVFISTCIIDMATRLTKNHRVL